MYHEALCNAPNSGIDGAQRYTPYEYGAIYFQLAGRRREVSGRRSGLMVCAYAVVFRHSQRLPCFPPLSPRSYKDPRFDSALTWGGLFTAEDERIRQHKVRSPCISLYPSQSARYCRSSPSLASLQSLSMAGGAFAVEARHFLCHITRSPPFSPFLPFVHLSAQSAVAAKHSMSAADCYLYMQCTSACRLVFECIAACTAVCAFYPYAPLIIFPDLIFQSCCSQSSFC